MKSTFRITTLIILTMTLCAGISFGQRKEMTGVPVKEIAAQTTDYKWLYSKDAVYISIDSTTFKKIEIEGEIIGATKPSKRDIIYVLTFNSGKSYLLEFNLNDRALSKETELPQIVRTRNRNWGDKIIASTSDGNKIAMVMSFRMAKLFLLNNETGEYKVIDSGKGAYTNYINISLNDKYYYLSYDNGNIQKIDINTLKKEILPLFNTSLSVPISGNRAIIGALEGNLRIYDFTKNMAISAGETGLGDKTSLKITTDETTIYALNVERSEIHSTNLKNPSEIKTYKLSDKGRDVYSMFLEEDGKVYVAFTTSKRTPVFIEGDLSNPHVMEVKIE